ncbi:PcfJ domain-containing protein [Photobacterium sanguinicancri]|uniref:PcfJ domain-containing protein n=1 Tax=Photobacterium sanguinicancri TaxID=875932 RepID=UPI0026E2CA2C|nr:PcfJ domain-containing protein [Photobacterium sanguinicancri]MDO6498819.1 PcfJ domain-containing protein [Photobacterium sanguinicancri]
MTALTISTTELGYDFDIELSSWHNKLSGYRVFPHERTPLDGGLGIGLNFVAQYDLDGEWLSQIPERYLAITEPFPEYQYQLLWLAANSAAAAQILASRPIILVLVCHRFRVDNESALRLCQLGQRCILQALGFDGRKAALKFLDRLNLRFNQGSELEHIIRLLNVKEQRYLKFKHYSSIEYNNLVLDQIHPFLTGSRLGLSVAKEQRGYRTCGLATFQDVLMLGRDLGIHDPIAHIVRQPSLAALEQLHDRWTDQRNQRIYGERVKPVDHDVPYPLPLKGSRSIIPIKDYQALVEEGRKQRHCISVYHSRITSERYCAFSMQHPERLTIGIRRLPHGRFPFEIDQISGVKNALPSEESRQLVHAWFSKCRQTWCAETAS